MAFSFRAGTNWCHDFPKLARESGFCFNIHKTRVRVDWNRISSIDIDRVIRERDFTTVDESVNNVVDYCLESEYDVKILDPNFVKLFRLAQLAVEYLLYCKQYLDHSVIILKDELRLKIEENAKLKKESNALEEVVKDLKEKVKERDKIIESRMGDSHGELHKCPHCMKTFISAMFLSAHIVRRHPNLSDPYSSTSLPMQEQYRAETEKLHNEIKTLKERINETERVIRSESEKVFDYDQIDRGERLGKYERGEHRSHIERDERMEEQHKRYQEEIASLKNMLFNEIRNLKQRDRSKSPIRRFENNTPRSNFEELITQQEREIQTLKEQLHDRLSPDVGNIHNKLQVQENYWKTKIENLERQHHSDAENLLTQLKLTQEAANRIKSEYEAKVNSLETQSISQTKILTTQGEQLKHLLRDMRDSRKVSQGDFTRSRNGLQEESSSRKTLKRSESVRDVEQSYRRSDEKSAGNSNNGELLFEDVGSTSSQESPKKLMISRITKNKFLKADISTNQPLEDEELQSSDICETIKKISKQERSEVDSKKSQNPSKKLVVENLNLESLKSGRRDKVIESSPERHSYREDIIETFRQIAEKPSQRSSKKIPGRNSPYIGSVQDVGEISKNTVRESHADIEKAKKRNVNPRNEISTEKVLVRNPIEKVKNQQKSMVESEDSESYSETESESETSESESQTASGTESTEEDQTCSDNVRTVAPKPSYKEVMQENPELLEELRRDLNDIFEKKLKDLGIDPEWDGLPKASFQQKMETVKHHENIHSKKLSNYSRVRQKILEEVTQRLSRKKREPETRDLEKKSPLDKLMTRVKTKAMNVLRQQKESRTPILKSQPNTPRDVTPRRKSSLEILPKKMSQTEMHESDRKKAPINLNKNRDYELQPRSQPLSVRSTETSRQREHEVFTRNKNTELVNHNRFDENLVGSSNSLKQMSHSYESIKDFLEDTRNTARAPKLASFAVTGSRVTSTPNKTVVDVIEESYSSITDESESQLTKQEKAHSLPASPKNSKSVLKSTTGSVGSLVKKRVIFDLEQSPEKNKESPKKNTAQDKSLEKLFPEYDFESKELNDDDWNISSLSDGKEDALHRDNSASAENIVLKTSQSDKIAQISRKIQEQLSISRQKPIGAIEAMFLTKPASGDQKSINQYPSSTSITSSILESPTNRFQVKPTDEKNKLPQPAPRTPRTKGVDLSSQQTPRSNNSDLDSDIEELLHME